MNNKRYLKKLFTRAGNGSIHEWSVWTEGDLTVTKFGLVNGKKQIVRKQAEAKSIGRSNETTPYEQAELEAQSLWNAKIDRGYKTSEEEAEKNIVLLPMLAKDFAKHGKKVIYPAAVQPKLDGLRCMGYWDVEGLRLISRRGKEYNLPHIHKELENYLPGNLILDGELYLHGEGFQTITSWIKRLQEHTYRVEFHVYDCIVKNKPELGFRDRLEFLKEWHSKHSPKYNKIVTTQEAASEEEVYKLQSQYCAEGFEGAIVRNYHGIYKFKHRSPDLLKVKDFRDDEYKVIDWERGHGRFENCPIWICETKSGASFRVVSKGTMEERQEMLRNADKYIGQWLKVKYFDLTDGNVPRFPVGVGFRLPEDM